MDLDKLPHFGSGSVPPLRSVASSGAGDGHQPLARASATTPRPRSTKAEDWRLVFPHGNEEPVPSYVEEIQDVKQLFWKKLTA
jgi:hypothetical protein